MLGGARLVVAVVPFRYIHGLLGEHRASATDAMTGEIQLAGHCHVRASQIATLVTVAAAHCPWRADCYPQALTARTMLTMSRIPHTVSFGVRRDEDRLRAHAWVRAGDVVVTGATEDDYTEVAAFVWSPRSSRRRA
jgi:hypothetical protein